MMSPRELLFLGLGEWAFHDLGPGVLEGFGIGIGFREDVEYGCDEEAGEVGDGGGEGDGGLVVGAEEDLPVAPEEGDDGTEENGNEGDSAVAFQEHADEEEGGEGTEEHVEGGGHHVDDVPAGVLSEIGDTVGGASDEESDDDGEKFRQAEIGEPVRFGRSFSTGEEILGEDGADAVDPGDEGLHGVAQEDSEDHASDAGGELMGEEIREDFVTLPLDHDGLSVG